MNNPPNNRKLVIISCRNNSVEDFERAAVFLNNINEELNWRGRRVGISGLHQIKRTPLMLAATYGSLNVLGHILNIPGIEINKTSSTDYLTALDCAYLYKFRLEILNKLRSQDAKYFQWNDPGLSKFYSSNTNRMDYGTILNYRVGGIWETAELGWHNQTEYFMMFVYKINSCNNNDNHLPHNCPYLHPNEDITRRRRVLLSDYGNLEYGNYACPDWPDHCPGGHSCPLAHGDYEIKFHPSEFRTTSCRYKLLCTSLVCSFAHHEFELREKFQMVNCANAQYVYGTREAQNAAAIQWQYDLDMEVPVQLWRPDFSNHGRSFNGKGLPNQHGWSTNSVVELWPPDFSNNGRSISNRGLPNQSGWPRNSVSSSTSIPFEPQSSRFQEHTVVQSPPHPQIVETWNAEEHGSMGHIVKGIVNEID